MHNMLTRGQSKRFLATMLAAATACSLVLAWADPTVAAELPGGDTVAEAAAAYDAGDPMSIAALAQAASPTSAQLLGETATGAATLTENGAFVSVDNRGTVSLSGEGVPDISIGAAGTGTEATISDGVSVQRDTAPGTNIVARATGQGAQLIAILEDSGASPTLDFEFDMPADAELVMNADGSVAVVADTTIMEPVGDSFDTTAAQVEKILGDLSDPEDISKEKWAQIEALPVVETQTTTTRQQIALIETPWAVDADGQALETHFELTGNGLSQVIETSEQTAFPVTADPSIVWWVWTATTCAANLATLLFGAAQLAKVITKMGNLVNRSVKLSAAVSKLGGAKAFLTAIYKAAKGFVEGRIGKYLSNSQRLGLAAVGSAGLSLVGDALGIGSCISLVKAYI
ncbi:hypothetical protein [Arthrobacter sp. HLT1-20]